MPYANNGNIKLHYQVEGSGPPLILAHGFMMDTACWYDFGYVEQFKSRHTLLILDARGHGKSDKPLETDSYNDKSMAYDVLSVMDKEGIYVKHHSFNSSPQEIIKSILELPS